MNILLLSLLALILCVIASILEIKSRELQKETLERMLEFCNKLSDEKIKLIEKIYTQKEKMKSKDKFITILTKQLNKERAEKNDIKNNLEFVTNNFNDEKLKEVLVTDNESHN